MPDDTPAAVDVLVSIVIPTYNSDPFLEATLDSALAQTHRRIEVLVVDNCSSDTTREIVESRAGSDERVRLVVNSRNVGPVANFRRCVELAQGEFIKFLMSDDLLDANCVERLLAPMLDDATIVLSTSRRRQVTEAGAPRRDTPSTQPMFEVDTVLDGIAFGDVALERNLNQIGEPSSVLFRAGVVPPDAAFQYHGVPFRVLADMSLWLMLLEQGRGSYLVDPLSSLRRHRGQDQMQPALLVKAHMEWVRLVRLARQRGYLATRRQRRRATFAFKPRAVLYAAAALRLVAR